MSCPAGVKSIKMLRTEDRIAEQTMKKAKKMWSSSLWLLYQVPDFDFDLGCQYAAFLLHYSTTLECIAGKEEVSEQT
jgi:hypothetical protein